MKSKQENMMNSNFGYFLMLLGMREICRVGKKIRRWAKKIPIHTNSSLISMTTFYIRNAILLNILLNLWFYVNI
jgi:hypothetical protein